MSKTKLLKNASIWMDDAFTPCHIKFKECDTEIEFFEDKESVRLQVYIKEDFICGMRLPLYAKTAIAQVLTGTLNGKRLFEQ